MGNAICQRSNAHCGFIKGTLFKLFIPQFLICSLLLSPAYSEVGLDPSAEAPPFEEDILEESITPPAVQEVQAQMQTPPMPTFAPPVRPQLNRNDIRPETGSAMLNFSDASLKDILRTVSEITGANFIIAPGVAARITVNTTKPLPKKDVFGIFESILEVNGLSAVKVGNYYKIVPAQNARQKALELFTDKDPAKVPSGDRMMNLIVPIEFISANDLMQVLKPMLSPGGNITSHPKSNTIIVTDAASNVKNYLDIINALDAGSFRKMKVSLYPIKNVDVKTLSKELTEVFTSLGFGKDTPQIALIPIERLNGIIVFSSTAELQALTKEWIDRLDVASSSEGSSIHIYYVQNDKASNLKNLLEQVYIGKKTVVAAAAAAISVQNAQSSQSNAQSSNASQSSFKYDGTNRNDLINNGETRIFIYEPTNALIIQSSQVEFQNILNTIEELDRPPKQVMIDALIAEVKLDESTRFGIQWSILAGNFNVQQNTGIFSSVINEPRANITAPLGAAAPSGLSVFTTDASKFFAALQALASTGKVNVLSNPHIIVKNYEKASINVGSDEPVATQSTQTAVTGTSGLIQNIEYRKTGVILTVVPQITEGGMVAMTVRQEVSDKSTDRTVGSAVYPSFTKREAETSIVAKDKETLVIGGLIQDRKDDSASGIPFISKIPLLGGLFRFTNKSRSKTELLILITPTVISNPEQSKTVKDEMTNKLGGLKKLLLNSGY